MHLPLTCQNCGTVLSAPGGRCPSCGAAQPGFDDITQVDLGIPQAAAPSRQPFPSARPRPPPLPQAKKKVQPLWFVVPIFIVLTTAVILAVLRNARMDREEELVKQQAAEAAERERQTVQPAPKIETINLSAAWSDATTRAKAWNKEAILVRVEASPLDTSGKLTIATGTARFEFGTPALGEAHSPLPLAGRERFVVTVDASGTKTAEVKAGPGVSSVPEPDCLVEEALRIGPADGVPPEVPRSLRYSYSVPMEKSVWVVSDASDAKKTRTLDGKTCSVVARQR